MKQMWFDTKMGSLQLTTITILLGIVRSQEPIQYSNCGQLGPTAIPLLANAHHTNHWPWHVAIYHQLNFEVNPIYKCGGTLVNSRSILTAAHCVVFNNVPLNGTQVSVSLGRLNLGVNEASAQSIEVAEIVAYENYSSIDYAHDIAIIILSASVTFNNYVKPICLWKTDKIDLSEVIGQSGTVVGFGLTEQGVQSNILREAALPVVPVFICLKSYPDFFGRHLSDTNFCAGLRNGTSVCTGDSGGSMTFKDAGLYYIRGIVSIASSVVDLNSNTLLCDSTQFALFTDVAQYLPWIRANIFRCETKVRCHWVSGFSCEVLLNVTPSVQDCDIIIDETSNTAVTRLSVTGETDFIPKFANAVTKFENLENLFLQGIKLKNVTRDRLSVFRNIKWLDMNNNEITELDAGTFDDLKNLAHFAFDGNGLKELHADLFKELQDLEQFFLRVNKIETLPANIFRSNAKLERLYLNYNQLRVLHSDIFKNLQNLRTLSLNRNKIEALPEDIFLNNKMLKYLYLDDNQLKELSSGVFQSLETLESLRLNGNKIETLPVDIFRYNIKLRSLYLYDNPLKDLHSDFFKGLPNLQRLYLSRRKNELVQRPAGRKYN